MIATNLKRIASVCVLAFAAFSCCYAQPAAPGAPATPPGAPATPPAGPQAATPTITGTVVNSQTLTITGTGFGSKPSVTVDGESAAVTSSTSTTIVATLPPSLAAGDYLLTITFAPPTVSAASVVTINAAQTQAGIRVSDSAGHSYPVYPGDNCTVGCISIVMQMPDGTVGEIGVTQQAVPDQGGSVLFTTTDCTGVAYIFQAYTSWAINEFFTVRSGVIYYASPNAQPQNITIGSLTITGQQCSQSSAQLSLVPAQTVSAANYLTPPFSLHVQ